MKQESYIEPLIQDKATIITGAHTKSLYVSGSLKNSMPKTICSQCKVISMVMIYVM